MHADGAELAVVDDDEQRLGPVADGRRQLRPRHEEIAVARDADAAAAGEERGGDRGGNAIAHRARRRGELRPDAPVVVEAVQPGGEIARAVRKDGLGRQGIGKLADDGGRVDAGSDVRGLGPCFVIGAGRGDPVGAAGRCGIEAGEGAGGEACGRLDGERGAADVRQLVRDGVDVHEALLGDGHGGERIAEARHLAEARAERDDEVGGFDAFYEGGIGAEAQFAGIMRMAVVEMRLAPPGCDDRDIRLFGELADGCAVLGGPARPADPEDRALGGGEHVGKGGERSGVGGGLRRGGASVNGGRGVREEQVLGQGDDDGTGPTRDGKRKGTGDGLMGARGCVERHDRLGEAAEIAVVVDFLKGFAAEHVGADVADEHDERGRILEGGVDADAGVRCAGTAGDHADARALAQLAIGLRHVRGSGFVPAGDEVNVAARVVKRIEDGEIAFSRDAEDVTGALGADGLDDGLRDGGHRAAPRPVGGSGQEGGVPMPKANAKRPASRQVSDTFPAVAFATHARIVQCNECVS